MDSPIIHLKDSSAIAAAHKEEVFSISGLVLNTDDVATKSPNSMNSSNDPPDLFEFSSDFSSEMSHAEDIIFGGKLIPFNESDRNRQSSYSDRLHLGRPEIDDKFRDLRQRRSGSLSERTRPGRSNSTKTTIMRASRSLDYQKLYGSSSTKSAKSTIERTSSVKNLGKTDANGPKEKSTAKPRWHFFIFGLVHFPSEMGLQDIKNRQVRRSRDTMFTTSLNAGGKDPLYSDDRKSTTWNILRVLSCKDDESVAVMEPAFSRLQRV